VHYGTVGRYVERIGEAGVVDFDVFHRVFPPTVQFFILITLFPHLRCLKHPSQFLTPLPAGKSSLLNVIAGRIASTKTLTIIGDVLIGGEKIDPVKYKQNIAYVMQDDAITPTSTVR